MYAYQTFGSNKLVNHLCCTFKIFQGQVLVGLNFGELTSVPCHVMWILLAVSVPNITLA